MSTYRGPNVQVTQKFNATPPAIAIEALPPVAVGTAYDVYDKEPLDTWFGVTDKGVTGYAAMPWGTSNKVVNDVTVIGNRGFDFYPPRAFVDSPFGDVELNSDNTLKSVDFDSTGIKIDRDDMYEIPNTAKAAGSCEAFIPYYKLDGATITVSAVDLKTVTVTGGALATAKVKPGQKVFLYYSGAYNDVGTIASVDQSETKLTLASPLAAVPPTISKIVIGAATVATVDIPDTLFDPKANFVANKVQVGDIVMLSSASLAGSIASPELASVVSVINANTIRFNTVSATSLAWMTRSSTQVDINYLNYKKTTGEPGVTVSIYEYSINRLIGFGQNYGLSDLATPTTITVVDARSFTIATSGNPILKTGDIVSITAKVSDGGSVIAVERDITNHHLYRVESVTAVTGGYWRIAVDSDYVRSITSVAAATGDFLHAWTPKSEHSIKATFRAIRSEELGVPKRIASEKDIMTAYVRSGDTSISFYNELAYMAFIEFSLSGGKVVYANSVDASSDNLAAEYSSALESMKLLDVYSHALGTTDPGVNALLSAYCDDQSAPYEAHERIAIAAYDEADVYLQGQDTVASNSTASTIVADGAIDLQARGITVGDFIDVYTSAGVYVKRLTVVQTPTSSATVVTDNSVALTTGDILKFMCGRKDQQAVMFSAIGASIHNRRVKTICPGWFSASFGKNSVVVPPYYVSAARAGLDCGKLVSQSMTNEPVTIPGLSNYAMGTNFYWRKEQLDEIGGGGVDIQIQDFAITQSIKSRHDLTTNMDAVEYQEWSITKQVDVCAKTIRSATAPYIGRNNISTNLINFLKQICSVACTTLIKNTVVADVSVVSITRDEVIADKLNFEISATVFVAGNYYDITLSVKSR